MKKKMIVGMLACALMGASVNANNPTTEVTDQQKEQVQKGPSACVIGVSVVGLAVLSALAWYLTRNEPKKEEAPHPVRPPKTPNAR
jgi:hypothetical protein